MKKLLIIVDYRKQFWLTVRHKEASFHVAEIEDYFKQHDYQVVIKSYGDFDFSVENYSGYYVIYQSTEDPYLLYHEFTEDVLLTLHEQGAVLIPGFRYFRAHHNKVFMEFLRLVDGLPEMQLIKSRGFGAYEEYQAFLDSHNASYPHIVKLGEGAQSKNVVLVRCRQDARRIKRMMHFSDVIYWLKDKIKPFMKKTYPSFRPKSYNRRKIVVQNFIEGLSGDYKVLIFWDKVYVLNRLVRPNDFRASGSGLFSFPSDINPALLDFSEKVYKHYRVPMISMDIALKDGQCYLIEFQFLAFGTYTLEKAPFHMMRIDGDWKKIDGQSHLETEFSESIRKYIENLS